MNKYPEINAVIIVVIPYITFALFLTVNAIFYSIIKMGQNNSKLFMQYDFQKVLSIEMVTYYITIIVFISRIARILGNMIFGKLYLKIKDKMSISIFLSLSFLISSLLLSSFSCILYF